MNIYILIGGAYGTDYWTQQTPPDADLMESWSSGELVVIKVDSEMRAYQPDGSGGWEPITALPTKKSA